MATMVRECKNCKRNKPMSQSHEYQDKLHGANQRVHNRTAKGWRCTICGNEVEDRSSVT